MQDPMVQWVIVASPVKLAPLVCRVKSEMLDLPVCKDQRVQLESVDHQVFVDPSDLSV